MQVLGTILDILGIIGDAILLIVFTGVFYRKLKDKISNKLVAKLVSLLIADLITYAIIIVWNEFVCLLSGGSFYPISFGLYSIPLLRRFLNAFDSIKFVVSTSGFYLQSIKESFMYRYGVEYTLLMLSYFISYIINFIKNLVVVVYIIVFVIKGKEYTRKETNYTYTNTHKTKTHRYNDEFVIEELKKYKELLDQGILTQEEFDKKKKQILG